MIKKRPSSIDVARRAQVSQATVSYVLSGRTDKAIREETKARVLLAAEELGYLPNRLADGILRGKTNTIGVLMPDFAHSFNSQMLMGLEEAFAETGYRTLIAHNRNNPEMERHQVRLLMEHRVDGIVAVTDSQTIDEIGEWISEADRAGVPVVIVDDRKMEGVLDTIVSDDVTGARLAVEHLIQMGHTRIIFIGGGEIASTSRERRQGYFEALAAHRIAPQASWLLSSSYHSHAMDLTPVLRLNPAPTAAFAVSDTHAAMAMLHLKEKGIRVPEDFAVVGYGDLEWAEFLSLTSVHQNPKEMGRLAATRLISRLNGDESPPVTERLEPVLVTRLSSGRSSQ